jgi:hypothetical protein
MMVLILTIGIFAIVMTVMAVGLILTGRCLRGSCGGPEAATDESKERTCGVCGRKRKIEPSQET